MSHLAAGPLRLAVQMNLGFGHPREQVVQSLVERHCRRRGGAEHVGHHRHRDDRVGVAERIVEHRAQMLLELTGPRPVHGPVPGVVRPHRKFVDQQRAVGRLEELDGEHPHRTQFGGQPQRQLLRGRGRVAGQLWRGRDHLDADAVALHRLDHRPGRALAERRPRHQRREFPAQRHPLLDQHRHTIGQIVARDVAGIGEVARHAHAPAVVTAANRLDHQRCVYLPGERVQAVQVVEPLDAGVARHRGAQGRQLLPHHELVLGVHQGLRRRRHVDAFGDKLFQQLGRDMLVVESEHVSPGRDTAQVVDVGVRPDHHIGRHLRGRLVSGGGQDAQVLTQRDGGLVGHPGQLTTADHGDQRDHYRGAGTRHGHHGVMARHRRV